MSESKKPVFEPVTIAAADLEDLIDLAEQKILSMPDCPIDQAEAMGPIWRSHDALKAKLRRFEP